MKNKLKIVILITALICIILNTINVSCETPESYMGFSVSEEWCIFSKNMTDKDLLESVDLTEEEVNEILFKSGCEYFITNPKDNKKIYVKLKKNELTYELYNISEVDDQLLKDETGKFLDDIFSVDSFRYDVNNIVITAYPDFKFLTIPGTITLDGENHGLVFGITFVNGNGIGFVLHLDYETVTDEDIKIMSELSDSLSFTVIKEKESDKFVGNNTEDKSITSISYIVGGLCAVALVAVCLYFADKIKKSEIEDDAEENNENNQLN